MHACGERGRHIGQCLGVYAHARRLHVGQHPDERHLYVVEQRGAVGLVNARAQHVVELQRDVGILGGVGAHGLGRHVAHTLLALALGADELVDVYGLVAEQRLGHVVHVVPQLGLEHVVGEHGVEELAAEGHAVAHEHLHVVLYVLSHLQYALVLVQRTEYLHYAPCLLLIGRHGHVVGGVGLRGEAQAHEFGIDGVGRGGLRVQTENRLCK